MKIEDAIQQKAFKNEYQKLSINILFTASWMSKIKMDALKPFNLSWQQFNILKILRGRHPEPASVKILTERMVDKMSNASRLVEKLKQKGFVERVVAKEDRRKVDIFITDKGVEILDQAYSELERQLHLSLKEFPKDEAKTLNRLLDQLRESSEG